MPNLVRRKAKTSFLLRNSASACPYSSVIAVIDLLLQYVMHLYYPSITAITALMAVIILLIIMSSSRTIALGAPFSRKTHDQKWKIGQHPRWRRQN